MFAHLGQVLLDMGRFPQAVEPLEKATALIQAQERLQRQQKSIDMYNANHIPDSTNMVNVAAASKKQEEGW